MLSLVPVTKTGTAVVFLMVLMSWGNLWAQQAAPVHSAQPAKPPQTAALKYPEQKPILDRVETLNNQVGLARAHGKITNQQALDLENQIDSVRRQMSAYKKENHKTIHSDHLTQDQIASLMSTLDEKSKLIPN